MRIFAFIFLLTGLMVSCSDRREASWAIADNPLLTEWALQVDPDKPWDTYPRPAMKRKEWMNLNGLWDYAITPVNSSPPEEWDGKILVPYPLESALSGVKRRISENEIIWYRTTFSIPSKWKNKRLMLNFEASDWETVVLVNGKEAGSHRGGYNPFTIEITDLVENGRNAELLVSVWDPTDKGTQPRGKQVTSPGGIWYTPASGIWQTVWIEPVADAHISSFFVYTSVKEGSITVKPQIADAGNCSLKLTVSAKGRTAGVAEGTDTENLTVTIDNPVLWSPANPHLYDLKLELIREGKIIDQVTSVAGIREVSLGKTEDGFTRILLNGEFLFQNGTLDQGFWPDGIYTPPSEEAMISDLWMLRKMEFNMLRKHVKVENRVFYNWCDRIGLLVWQDMPNGDRHISGSMPDIKKDPESGSQFRYELRSMIETRFNHPSIIVWVPFNEGWGQHETYEITEFIKEIDTTRLVNSASGWTDRGTGDILDIHNYPDPRAPEAEEGRAIVLGEFGGLGLPVANHTWEQRNWGYRNMSSREDLLMRYEDYYSIIRTLVSEKGLSAVVYTQTTDVETETNGLLTYDRKVDKMGADNISKAHQGIIPPYMVNASSIFIDTFRLELACPDSAAVIRFTADGKEPSSNSALYTGPIEITSSTTVRSKAWYGTRTSRTRDITITAKEPLMAESVQQELRKGLSVNIYEGSFDLIPDFEKLQPVANISSDVINQSLAGRESGFAMVFEGYINIPETGVYGFCLTSDDGSRLFVGRQMVADNDGIHGMIEKTGFVALKKGIHTIRLEYFQRTGGAGLGLHLIYPCGNRSPVPGDWLLQ